MPILGEKLRFNRANLDRVPDTTGVYALYVDGEVAYYGAAGGRATIRSRLAEHLVGSSQPSRGSAHQFSFEITKFPLSRECALLEEHKRQTWRLPAYNVRPRAVVRGASRIEADEVLQCVVAEMRHTPAGRLEAAGLVDADDTSEVAEAAKLPVGTSLPLVASLTAT